MEEQMIKTFEEKKEHAQLMRNIFCITAVLFIGFIIWIACIHRYEILWWAFLVWLLLVGLAVSFHSRKKDAELALKYMDRLYYPWIRVDKGLPEEDQYNKEFSVDVIGLFPSGKVGICHCSLLYYKWYMKGFLGTVEPTHWMYIPKVNP